MRPTYPASRTQDLVDTVHGVPVPDPYRWLEDGNSDEVRAWTDAQNALTAAWLERSPARSAIQS
ncbi:MAG TPA: hypothetical protein VJN95_11875, partial [Gemmatimonadales bacterium]|nr:hypothetical protein [Gemmatimonadales bacterium]